MGKEAFLWLPLVLLFKIIIFINLFFLTFFRTSLFMPRAPTTIASQVACICRSDKLLNDYAVTSMVSKKGLADKLGIYDRKCLFGWFWWKSG